MEALFILFWLALPIAWGLVCAAVPLAFAFIVPHRGLPSAWLLAAAWIVGFLAAEYEVVKILIGSGYFGSCEIPGDLMQKVPRYRPCSISEWRWQQLFPSTFDRLIWGWRSLTAVSHSAFFALLTVVWWRKAKPA